MCAHKHSFIDAFLSRVYPTGTAATQSSSPRTHTKNESDTEWSAPAGIVSWGCGWGFQVGGEVTDHIIVIESEEAMKVFTSKAQMSLSTAVVRCNVMWCSLSVV